ncbi:3-keto-5-aminohexanoate cleavage protein, partial [Actinoplanes sp. NPDC048791]|uniref:3-keto-5-aminohexanoate cleavage protein n=1 Tax=Actinoplanes sp. NPDC048791 TaxID=3154623 RepID=UPI0033D9824D
TTPTWATPGRRTSPGTARITGGDVARRHATVARWADLGADQRPSFASVNVGEDGFAELVTLLRGAGVGVEAGVWSPRDAERLDGVPVDRILIEILDTPAADAVAAADAILDRLEATGPRLLHGEQDACWPLIAHAGRLGLPTRIGLEDTLVTHDGRPATGNADLVRRALRVWTAQRERR